MPIKPLLLAAVLAGCSHVFCARLAAAGPGPTNSLATPEIPISSYLTSDARFQGIQPPGWVLEGVAKMFLSLDDHPAIDEAAALGVTVVHAGGPSLYYPLRKHDPSSGIPAGEKAKLLAGIARAQQHSMRVVLGISPYAPTEIVRQHPEWIARAQDNPPGGTSAALDPSTPTSRALPLNTPYGDYAIECLAEMLRDLGVDGISFDGCYHPPINLSAFEKLRYRQETGREVPPRIDLNDVAYRVYLLWAGEKLEAWYRRLGDRLRQVNPEAAVYTWTVNAGRYGHFLTSPRVMPARLNRLICPVQEWWLDEVNLGATVVPYFGAAYVRAVAGGAFGASEPYLMSRGNPYSTDSFPPHELTVRCLGAMVNGSFTPLATMAGQESTYATLREIHRRKPWFVRLAPEPWSALLVSEPTRQFYAHGHIMDRWLAHALGFFRLGLEEHLPVTLITELDLTPAILRRFRVLFLPNVACLSDAQVDIVREYVRGGGGLVATGETSLCDELGRPRPDFALRDLWGATYQGRVQAPQTRPELDAHFAIALNEAYWTQRANAGALRFGDFPGSIFATDPRLRRLVPNGQASFKGPMVRLGAVSPPHQPAILYFPEGRREAFPCASTGEWGAGRVVYFAAGVDAANFAYGYPYHRILLARAARWAAREEYPVQVKAPMCVQSTFWRPQGGTNRTLIVHLWNGLNSTSDHGLQDVEVPLREESVAIHGIELRLTGPRPVDAFAEPGHTPLEVRAAEAGWRIRVPPLEIHAAVVIRSSPGADPGAERPLEGDETQAGSRLR